MLTFTDEGIWLGDTAQPVAQAEAVGILKRDPRYSGLAYLLEQMVGRSPQDFRKMAEVVEAIAKEAEATGARVTDLIAERRSEICWLLIR